jgi:hypothetical protein
MRYWMRVSGLVTAGAMLVAGCAGIPAFPGTGPPPATATSTARPAAPNLAATVEAAVAATLQGGPVAASPSPAEGGRLAPLLLTPAASPGSRAADALTAVAGLAGGASSGSSGSGSAAAVRPGDGAESPEAAIRRAYEAAAVSDQAALEAVTDPDLRGGPSPLRFMSFIGQGGRQLTLQDMRYTVEQTNETTATVHVTGRLGNVPILGEREIDERETARKIGSVWFLSRGQSGAGR